MATIIRYGELLASNFSLGPWGEHTCSAEGCRLMLEGNPFITDATPVYADIRVRGETAAHVFLYPDQFQCRTDPPSHPLSWLWMTDYRTLPAYRNSGAGVLLIQHLRRQLEREGYCLGGINMSADSQRVFEALRFPVFEKIPRYVLPLRSRPILTRYRPLRPILPLACRVGNLALRLYVQRAAWRMRGPHIHSSPGWEPLPSQCPVSAFDKSTARLDWILGLPPHGGRSLEPRLLYSAHSAKPIGRILLRSKPFASIAGGRFRDLRILSVLEADSQDPAQLVRAVLAHARQQQPPADVIEWCEDRPPMQACLQRAGFRNMGTMAFCASRPIPTPHHITQGDGDAGL